MNLHLHIHTQASHLVTLFPLSRIHKKDKVMVLTGVGSLYDESEILEVRLESGLLSESLQSIYSSEIKKGSIKKFFLHFGSSDAEQVALFIRTVKIPDHKLHMSIYEDSPTAIATRMALEELSAEKRKNVIDTYVSHIHQYIHGNANTLISSNGWNAVISHCFSNFSNAVLIINDKVDDYRQDLQQARSDRRYIPTCFDSELKVLSEFIDENTLFVLASRKKNNLQSIDLKRIITTLLNNNPGAVLKKVVIFGWVENPNLPKDISCMTVSDDIPLLVLYKSGLMPIHMAGYFSQEMFLFSGHKVLLTLDSDDSKSYEAMTHKFDIFSMRNIFQTQNEGFLCSDNIRIFRCAASMGDVIYVLNALAVLKKTFSEKFVLIANPVVADLVNACSVVDYFWPMDQISEDKVRLVDELLLQKKVHLLDQWKHILAPMHMSLAFINDFLPNSIDLEVGQIIDLSNTDISRVIDFQKRYKLVSDKTVLVHPNIGAANRTWTKSGWNQVVDHLISTGWQVVIIGSEKNVQAGRSMFDITNPHAISAVNLFSIMETIELMNRSALVISCDSGPVALAGLTSIGIVAIYSQIHSAYRLPFRNGKVGWNSLAVDLKCEKYGQCGRLIAQTDIDGKRFAEWCPNMDKYVCLRSYPAEKLIQTIDGFIQSENFVAPLSDK